MGIFSVIQTTAPRHHFLDYESTCTYYPFWSLPNRETLAQIVPHSSSSSTTTILHLPPLVEPFPPLLLLPPLYKTRGESHADDTDNHTNHADGDDDTHHQTNMAHPSGCATSTARFSTTKARIRERREATTPPTDVARPSGCATSATTYSMTNARNPGTRTTTMTPTTKRLTWHTQMGVPCRGQ